MIKFGIVLLRKKLTVPYSFLFLFKLYEQRDKSLNKEFMPNNIFLSLITELLFAQSFNQEISYMWITIETSVRVSATLKSFRHCSTWWRHREDTADTSWTYCNSCQLRRRYILSSTKQVVLCQTSFCPFF